MSERETATELVKRLEAGEAGREIDAEINRALNGACEIWQTDAVPPYHSRFHSVEAVTTSLDAAVALVERVKPGAWIQIDGPRKYLEIPTPVPNRWRGVVEPWDGKSERIGWGSTPAAALVAALLKAKGAGDE